MCTTTLLDKGAKLQGQKKHFGKNHCTKLLLIPHTKYRTEQHWNQPSLES